MDQAFPQAGLMRRDLSEGFAEAYFAALGRPDLVTMIKAGRASDFPEILAAASALRSLSDTFTRYEEALKHYADSEMWDNVMPGGPLALHDAGQMARNVLSGRHPFHNCD